MDLEIKDLLVNFRDDDSIIEKLRFYDLALVTRVALNFKLFDEWIKIFKPLFVNGTLRYYYDIFSMINGGGLKRVINSINLSDDEKKYIDEKIFDIDISLIRKMKIGNTLSRDIAGSGHSIDSVREVILYSEPACYEAILLCFNKNIVTTYNDTDCVYNEMSLDDGFCRVRIDYNSFDSKNKVIADYLISANKALYINNGIEKLIEISVPCTRDSLIGDVSDKLLSIISLFEAQDVSYEKLNDEGIILFTRNIISERIRKNIYPDFNLKTFFLNYFSSYTEETLPGVSRNIKFIENDEILDSELMTILFENSEILNIALSEIISKKSIYEWEKFISEFCYIDGDNGLIFNSYGDYLKHQRFMAK